MPGSRKLLAAVPLGLLLSGAMVWHASYAAFSSTTTNANNAFSAGSVTLTDNRQPSSAMFSVNGLIPGNTASSCIRVSYTGSLAAAVKMYVVAGDLTTSTTRNLGDYLTISVAEGTGTSLTCGDFSGTTIYNPSGSGDPTKTLSAFAASSTNFATGISTFAPSGSGQTKTYKVTYWMQNDPSAAGMNAGVKFTWEAQNT